MKSIGAIRTSQNGHVVGSPARQSRSTFEGMRDGVHLSFSEQQMRRADGAKREAEARVGAEREKERDRINWVAAWAWFCEMVLLAGSLVVACFAPGVAVSGWMVVRGQTGRRADSAFSVEGQARPVQCSAVQ